MVMTNSVRETVIFEHFAHYLHIPDVLPGAGERRCQGTQKALVLEFSAFHARHNSVQSQTGVSTRI